jgi:hypothetical protein
MTALNGFAHPDAAYLLVDAATLDGDGNLHEVRSKVVYARHISAAGALSGHTPSALLETRRAELAAVFADAQDYEGLLGSVTRLARQAHAENAAARFPLSKVPVNILIAVFAGDGGGPQLWMVATDDADQPAPIRRLKAFVNNAGPGAPVPGLYGLEMHDLVDASRFMPSVHGARLAEAQRELTDDDGVRSVGGYAELVTVNSEGVSSRILTRWPDQLGAPIDPLRTRGVFSRIAERVRASCRGTRGQIC